jgi:hypothetical protein
MQAVSTGRKMAYQRLLFSLLVLSLSAGLAGAQPGGPGGPPAILKEPADWRFEKMPTPPGFAPDIKLRGFEEARFSPGMFDTSSPDYFTYVLVIAADGAPQLDKAGLKDFLEKYYRGLCGGLGERKGIAVDSARMVAEVTPAGSGPDAAHRYTGKVTIFDTFNDGRKVMLNVEAHVIPRPGAKKTYLSLLISPQGREAAVWKKLHEIERSLQFDEP